MTSLEKTIKEQLDAGWQLAGFERYHVAKKHAVAAGLSLKADGHNLPDKVRRELQRQADLLYKLCTGSLYYR